MKHVAGLDGLRAVAVAVVLLFHAEVPYASGGFLGVSLFFTLSGYLITTLLVAEHDATGTISLRRFYGRRARRLLPAAYLCLLAVVSCAALWSAAQLRHLRADLLASVANVANWRFAFAPTSYQELFTSAPSPVAHFWSLAIEEQVYLVIPVVALVALRSGRRSLLTVTVALLAASVAATLLTADRDLVYNGTHTRAAEVLVGALLAQLVARRGATRLVGRGRWVPGAVALGSFAVLVVGASVDQGWIYRGGLPAVAVVSATLIWAVTDGRFPAGLLALGPLVAIGRVSYGIYLFHWPIFLLLDAERTGVGGAPLFALRCVATGIVTVVVYQLVEQPVRSRRVLTGSGLAPAMGLVAAVVAVAAIVVVPRPGLSTGEQLLALGDQSVVEFSTRSPGTVEPSGTAPASSPRPASTDGPDPTATVDTDPANGNGSTVAPESTPGGRTEPASVVVVGSDRATADALVDGLDPGVARVDDATRPDCPLSVASAANCAPINDVVASFVGSAPDVIVFATGIAEARDALLQKQNAVSYAQIGDLGRREEAAIAATVEAIDLATASGATVIWYTPAQTISMYYRQFQRIGVMRTGIAVLHAPAWQLADAVEDALVVRAAPLADEDPTRVMVIGDSTSLYLAQALHDGSDGRMTVLWAGANGCAIADVVATRDSAGRPWVANHCERYDEKLPPILAEFAPDAVVVMTGPTELNDQQYADGSDGHAGDTTFGAQRDAGFQRILDAVGADMPVLVADLPALLPGQFTKGDMTSVDRLAAANAQVVDWATTHAQVGVFEYRGALESAEAVQGRLRADGMHADPVPLEELARTVYVDRLLAQIDGLRAILRP